jgi:hypothetical protein
VCLRIDNDLLPEIEVQERKIKDWQNLRENKQILEDAKMKEVCLSWWNEDQEVNNYEAKETENKQQLKAYERNIKTKEDELKQGNEEYDQKKHLLEDTMQKELEEMKSKNQEV